MTDTPPVLLRHRLTIAAIVLGSLALKLYLVKANLDIGLFGDGGMYVRMSRTWAAGGGYTVDEANLWPPGMVTFLGLHVRYLGNDLLYPRLTQCFLSAATVFFVWRAALAVFGRPWRAAAATAVVAFYPTLVAFTHFLWSETLYLFFFCGAVAAYFEGLRRDRRGWFALAGVALGLAALTRSIGLYFAAPWVLWHLWNARGPGMRRAVGHVLVFAVAVSACILPWTWRNYKEYGRFVLVDMSVGRNLYYGHNALGPPNWDYGLGRPFSRHMKANRTRCDEIPGMTHPKDVEICEIRNAIQFVKDDPGLFFYRFGVKMADLYAPTDPIVEGMATGKYKPKREGEARLRWFAVAIVPWLLCGVGVVMALTLTRWDRWKVWLVMLVGYTMLIHWLTTASSRYRVAILPFLLFLAVIGYLEGPGALRHGGWRSRRALAFYALLAVVFYMWSTRAGGGLQELIDAYLLGKPPKA